MPVLPHARKPHPAGGLDTQSVRSAAWLAGEQLFQAPPRAQEPAAVPVVVTLRRSRVAPEPARGGSGEAPEHPDAPASEWKGARIFRVEAPGVAAQTEDEPAAPAGPRTRPARRGRIGVDRRPGPVVQVFKAEPVPAQEAEPAFDVQVGELNARLARVRRLLAEARHAQSLRF